MRDLIKTILREEVDKSSDWEYHLRYIDGLTVYKRKKGDEKWTFADPEDFADKAHELEIVKWENKK